jgi:hypothetical protein
MTFHPEMDAKQFFAARREDKLEIAIADDVGTDYFESGSGGGGGVRVSHSSQGFAPAPPPRRASCESRWTARPSSSTSSASPTGVEAISG